MENPSTFKVMFLYYKWESRGLFRYGYYATNGKAEHCLGNLTKLQMEKPRTFKVMFLYYKLESLALLR
jgi:hypothetical protein